MGLNLIFWILCFFIDLALLSSNFYQLVILSDLEADYLNPYESTSRINFLIVPEFILHGVFCALFLFTWHWFLFLVTLPLAIYSAKLFKEKKHLIDVTEVFRALSAEKKIRLVKLAFYLFLLFVVIFRVFTAGMILFYSSEFGELDIRSSFLQF
ncbi:Cornichon [Trema orientale]|uniref:Cornichon n=1 Tax=Trema orientale TaxID=63057 RepID=A0A2P5F1I7_TREOI|nr:Cornichon [Trema orientale]